MLENYFGTLLIAHISSDFLAQYFPPALSTTNCRQEWGLLVITVESLTCYWALLCICIIANESTKKIKVFSVSPLKISEQMACMLYSWSSYCWWGTKSNCQVFSNLERPHQMKAEVKIRWCCFLIPVNPVNPCEWNIQGLFMANIWM